MNSSISSSPSFTRAAKLMIASLPATAILVAAAIALAAQPSSATPGKPIGVPDRYPAVNWPAPGAGDLALVSAALPAVNWPALGAGDFVVNQPARLPTIHWPALGAGDFEPTK